MDEATNEQIREHEIQTTEWRFSKLSKEFYVWFERFNERFFAGKLPTVAISFKRTRINSLGHYVIDRNEFGLKWNINLNSVHLERPLAEILKTLLHEMIHQWQESFGKNSKGNYHNVEYQKKSRELGIQVNAQGVTIGYDDPFVSFIREHGVNAESRLLVDAEGRPIRAPRPVPGKSKLKLWSCGCTKVRVAVKDFRAKCLKCGNEFVRSTLYQTLRRLFRMASGTSGFCPVCLAEANAQGREHPVLDGGPLVSASGGAS